MNRNKVLFGVVSAKPIETTDCDEDINDPSSPKRGRAQSSAAYSQALNHDLLRAPVTR